MDDANGLVWIWAYNRQKPHISLRTRGCYAVISGPKVAADLVRQAQQFCIHRHPYPKD
jgi:hypothetical protein